jgi:hypothetical protein
LTVFVDRQRKDNKCGDRKPQANEPERPDRIHGLRLENEGKAPNGSDSKKKQIGLQARHRIVLGMAWAPIVSQPFAPDT